MSWSDRNPRQEKTMPLFGILFLVVVTCVLPSMAQEGKKKAAPAAAAAAADPAPEPAPPPVDAASVPVVQGEPLTPDPVATGDPAADPTADPNANPDEAAPKASGTVDLDQLVAECEGLVRGGTPDDALAKIEEAGDVLSQSVPLTEVFLKAQLAAKIPAWMNVKREGERLLGENKNNTIANLAMGRYWSEGAGKKINDSTALKHFAAAKAAKDAPPEVATLYYKCFLRANKFLLIAVFAIIGGGIGFFIKKRKQKAAELPAELFTTTENATPETTAEKLADASAEGKPVDKGEAKPEPKADAKAEGKGGKTEAKPEAKTETKSESKPESKAEPKTGKTATKTTVPPKPAPKAAEVPAVPAPATEAPGKGSSRDSLTEELLASLAPKKPAPAASVPAPAPQPAAGPATMGPKPGVSTGAPAGAPAGAGEDDLDLSAMAAVLPRVPAPGRPGLPTDPELLKRWEDLQRQAASRPLPLGVRDPGDPLPPIGPSMQMPQAPGYPHGYSPGMPPMPGMPHPAAHGMPYPGMPMPGAYPGWPAPGYPYGYPPYPGAPAWGTPSPAGWPAPYPPSPMPGQPSGVGWTGLDQSAPPGWNLGGGDVGLDLSDANLREDLLGKLKMLAIEDGELRALLLQRNPEHLPHFIEYIQLKPDPVRLAYVARELGYFGDPAVVDVLSGLLFHEDNRVAVAAIQGLQINGSVNAILQLCPMLQSDKPVLVETAKNALLTLGPQYILNAFADLPTNPDERIRDGAVFVLQRMTSHPKVFELLTAMLHDRSERVRKKVILAMAFQKNPAFITILREYYRDTPDDEEKKLIRKAMIHLQAFTPKPTVSGRP